MACAPPRCEKSAGASAARSSAASGFAVAASGASAAAPDSFRGAIASDASPSRGIDSRARLARDAARDALAKPGRFGTVVRAERALQTNPVRRETPGASAEGAGPWCVRAPTTPRAARFPRVPLSVDAARVAAVSSLGSVWPGAMPVAAGVPEARRRGGWALWREIFQRHTWQGGTQVEPIDGSQIQNDPQPARDGAPRFPLSARRKNIWAISRSKSDRDRSGGDSSGRIGGSRLVADADSRIRGDRGAIFRFSTTAELSDDRLLLGRRTRDDALWD